MKLILVLGLAALVYSAPTTYDQRQDGGVNVRADLQNLLIVAVVPKISGDSSSLLADAISSGLFTKKALKNANRRNHVEPEPVDDQDNPDKVGDDSENPDNVIDAFVEPKTPYQVDISEAKSNLAKLYPIEAQPVDLYLQSKSAQSSALKISSDESPVPNVVPVKDNKYVTEADRDAKEIEVIEIVDNLTVSKDGDDDKEDVESLDESSKITSGKGGSSSSSGSSASSGNIRDSGAARSAEDKGELLLLGAMEQCGPDRYRDNEGVCRFIDGDKK